MSNRWDETWHRLREWTNGQGPSERLAAQILLSEGFVDLDPSHPLGGPDGGKDALTKKDEKKWVMAVYFPRGQKSLREIKKKLLDDLPGVALNGADALAFVTNQELTVVDRAALKEAAEPAHVELYHLERITTVLDKPVMAAVRKQFLSIDFEPPPQRTRSVVEEVFGPDWEPNIFVLQKNEASPGRDLQADEFLRVRVYADVFRRGSFEPDDEEDFVALIHQTFGADSAAQLEAPSDDRVLVEHRSPELLFHRRWGWWTSGALGMSTTLRDLHRHGAYSVADIAMDVARFLVLVGELGRGLGAVGEARVLVGMDPGRLRPEFDPSDRIARERLGARLSGVRSVARPTLERSRETPVEGRCALKDLPIHAVQLTAESIVSLLRRLHGARISTNEFEASIPLLLEAAQRARHA